MNTDRYGMFMGITVLNTFIYWCGHYDVEGDISICAHFNIGEQGVCSARWHAQPPCRARGPQGQ